MSADSREKFIQNWFLVAADDLRFAEAGYKETKIARDACFLCHQSAEKYLKGFLISTSQDPPRVHLLLRLLDIAISQDDSFRAVEESCRLLDNYYNPARYPDDVSGEYSATQAEEALMAAQKVKQFVMSKINPKFVEV